MLYIGFPIVSLIYLIIFIVIYYSKERMNIFENKILSYLMIINGLGLILELACYIVLVFIQNQDTIIGMTILKSYIFYMYVFDYVLTTYIMTLTSKKYDDSNYDSKTTFIKMLLSFSPIVILGFALSFIPNLNYYNIYPKYYTYGISTDGLIWLTLIIAPLWMYRCIKIIIIKKDKKYIKKINVLLLGIIFVGIAGALMQFVDRSMLIITSAHTIMLILVYFTIENPDLKMVRQLEKNKELIENDIEEKTNLLFGISQEVKTPINNIELIATEIVNSNDMFLIKERLKKLHLISKNVNSTINNILNISNMDIVNTNFVNNAYDSYNLFNEIILLVDNKLKDNVDFKYSLSSTIPKKLYGDSLKLKQIIYSVLINSINNTNVGCVDLSIDVITRNDICRLIINIRDTAKTMSIYEINKILESDIEITKEQQKEIQNLEIDLQLTKKIINIIGGTFLIKSGEQNGNTYTIIINQKIDKKTSDSINKFIPNFSNKEKILLVDDDYKELELYTQELKENNYEVISTVYGRDCINRIRNGEKFDYIFLDDEMAYKNAVNLVKNINTTKVKVIIMLNQNKEIIKEKYLQDYPFYDYLLKNKFKEEIKRIKYRQ